MRKKGREDETTAEAIARIQARIERAKRHVARGCCRTSCKEPDRILRLERVVCRLQARTLQIERQGEAL